MTNAKEKKDLAVWPAVRRLLALAGKLRFWLYLAITVDLIQSGIMIAINHFNRRFFEAVSAGNTQAFWMFVWLSLGLSIISIPLSYVKTRGIGQFSEGTLLKLRQAVASHSAALPVAYLEERHSGDLLSVLNADLGKVKTLLANNLLDLVGQSVRGVAALAYIISINWILALVSTIITPLMFVLISALTKPVANRSEEMQAEIGQVNSVAQEGITGAMVIKSFNLVSLLNERFRAANQKALKKGLGIAKLKAITDGITLPMAITPFIIAIGLGGYLVIQKQMTFGSMFAFINLLNFVVNPLASLPAVINSIGEGSGASRRMFALADEKKERVDGKVTQPANPAAPAIAFQNVTFAYQNSAPVLKNVTLDIPNGQTVAIVGPSGGGKSTLVKLILGYYPQPDGEIQLFGSSLNDWNLSAARQQMAFVAQDTYLFPVSIGDNIRLGKPGASQAEVEQAARLANIHDFITSLPEGYDTPAGEWGSRLSGGQKQRISLSRAILKDAPILLLDEPTSALDTESEALVQQALERFSENRTTVVIAHRLSTIKNADRVLVLEDGEIIEQGTHDELLARGGAYLDLYQRQFTQEPAVSDANAVANVNPNGFANEVTK